jgi:hypothetical protein
MTCMTISCYTIHIYSTVLLVYVIVIYIDDIPGSIKSSLVNTPTVRSPSGSTYILYDIVTINIYIEHE